MAAPQHHSRGFGFRAVIVSLCLHVMGVAALLLKAKREPRLREIAAADDELVDVIGLGPADEATPAQAPEQRPGPAQPSAPADDRKDPAQDEPDPESVMPPEVKPRVGRRDPTIQPLAKPSSKENAAPPPDPVASQAHATPTAPLLSLSQGRRHIEISGASPSPDAPTDLATLRPAAGPIGPQSLGPAPASASVDSDTGLTSGGESMQGLRRVLHDYIVTDLSNGELEVRPTTGEFVATIRKDGSVKIEHAGVAAAEVCVLTSVCLAVGNVRDPGQKERKFLSRVRLKRNVGALKHFAKSIRKRNEALDQALVSGDVRERKALPMLLPLLSGGFGYRGKRAISMAELTFLDQTASIRLRMMEKESQRSFARARIILSRELRTVWSDRSLSPQERMATIWTWYLEIDTEPVALDDLQLAQTMKNLIEVRQRESIAAKRVVAQFVVEHPQGAEPGFGLDEVKAAQEFLAESEK